MLLHGYLFIWATYIMDIKINDSFYKHLILTGSIKNRVNLLICWDNPSVWSIDVAL